METHGSGVPDEDRMEEAALRAYFRQSDSASCGIGSVKADIGHTGAAAGLSAFIKTCLSLYQQILPSVRTITNPESSLITNPLYLPTRPQYWLRNRADGPRRAGVSSGSIDGNCLHVVLEEYECAEETSCTAEHIQPLGERDEALLVVDAQNQTKLIAQLRELQQHAAQNRTNHIAGIAREWWQRENTDPENEHY